MSETEWLSVGEGDDARRIATLSRDGKGALVVWLGGFKSDMASTKAAYLDAWAARNSRPFLRFDYSGHGVSEGRFEDGTIGRWLEESLAVIRRNAKVRVIRDGAVVADNLDLASLRREKDDVTEVREGFECGLVLRNFQDIKEGDVVEAFEMREIPRA